MDHEIVELQNELRRTLQETVSDTVDGRSEETDIPLAFVRNATPDDWRKLDEIRPTGF